MSDHDTRVLVFAGSIRNGSFNKKLAEAALKALRAAGIETAWADLKDYPMPFYDGDVESATGLPERAKAFKELLRSHDAFVIASPEYNGSFPALVKNVIDWTSRGEPGEPALAVYRDKIVAILSTSPGAGGGRRGLEHLRMLFERIRVNVIPEQLSIPRAGEAFDNEGNLTREEDRQAMDRMVEGLAAALHRRAAA